MKKLTYAENSGIIYIAKQKENVMPRPCKKRRVCFEPACRMFLPENACSKAPTLTMTVDEFEAIRLIDHEGMSQEECAKSMNVARTTVQAIYAVARAKLASMIVNGMALRIDGGDYVLCDEGSCICLQCGRSCGQMGDCCCKQRRNMNMRIAVTYENGEIFQHFGHTQYFKLYMIEGGEVKSSVVMSTKGSGHSALAAFLKMSSVDALICGGIGGGAQQALNDAGVKLYAGVSGDADAAVDALLKGTLRYVTIANCNHHDHADGHECTCHH